MPRLKKRSHKRFSHNALDVEARERGRANDISRYGELLPCVVFLRRQGWVVYEDRPYYRVGTKLVDAQGLYDIYERVRERYDRQERANQELEAEGRKTKTRRVGGTRNAKGRNKGGNRAGGGKVVSRGGSGQSERPEQVSD